MNDVVKTAYAALRAIDPWTYPESDILHHRVLPYATLAPWLNDEGFVSVYEKVKAHTLVDIYRCYELWTLAKQLSGIDGAILEVGVWRGGTGAILAEAASPLLKKVYLADTFKGVVKAGSNDTAYKGGEHSDTSLKHVRELVFSLNLNNVQLLEGIFPEETGHFIDEQIALLHCDVDVYSSAKDVVNWALPRMNIGSILIFDDYGFYGCEGIAKFVNEFRIRRDFTFIHNLNGHAIFIKKS